MVSLLLREEGKVEVARLRTTRLLSVGLAESGVVMAHVKVDCNGRVAIPSGAEGRG